jgi:hypothetical protein
MIGYVGEGKRQDGAADDQVLCVFAAVQRGSSAPLPKFVFHRGTLCHELRKQRGTSKFMFLVRLFDLKLLTELAANAAGTSNRPH